MIEKYFLFGIVVAFIAMGLTLRDKRMMSFSDWAAAICLIVTLCIFWLPLSIIGIAVIIFRFVNSLVKDKQG